MVEMSEYPGAIDLEATDPGTLDVVVDDELLYLRGDATAIDRVISDLFGPPDARVGIASIASTAGAIGATAATLHTTAETCFRLTAEGQALLDQFGPVLTPGGGAMRGFVRGDKHIAGQLAFQQVPLAAEQALALQTAAVSLALRTAIADVQSAVEKVDRKVSDIQRKVGAREIGEVVGSHAALQRIVASTDRRGRLLDADWDGIAGVGHQLEQAMTALRTYVTTTIGDLEKDRPLPKRADAVAEFARAEGVAGALRLITVAEEALHLWQYLRIERVRTTDPDHVESAVEDSRNLLRQQRASNREITTKALSALEVARSIDALEIHHLLGIRALQRASDAAVDELSAFATRAQIELPEIVRKLDRPAIADARAELAQNAQELGHQVGALAVEAGRVTKTVAADVPRRLRERRTHKQEETGGSSDT